MSSSEDATGAAVSVVIPVYNGEEFVAEAVESVYAQTSLPGEVIVVDDGSTDQTPLILSQFEGRPGFRCIRKPNGGVASARNVGIDHVTGEYVALLDHDDVWRPEKLERQLAHFRSAWGMSFTAYWHKTATASEVKVVEGWDPDPQAVTSLLLAGWPVAGPSTALIRRGVLDRIGPFQAPLSHGEDLMMWLRIARAGNQIGYLPAPLTEYRWHGANKSNVDADTYYNEALWIVDEYGDRRIRAWRRLNAAIDAREHHDRRAARRRIIQAARIRPWSIRPGWIRLLL